MMSEYEVLFYMHYMQRLSQWKAYISMYLCALECFMKSKKRKNTTKPTKHPCQNQTKHTEAAPVSGDSENPVEIHMHF